MHRALRGLTLGASLLALLATSAAAVSAADPQPAGHVYVNNNSAVHNTIAGFARHARRHPDRRCPARRSRPAAPAPASVIGSAGAIQFSDDGRYVFAVDAGSNDISVLAVRRDGSLKPGRHGPLARHHADQRHRPPQPRLRRQRRRRREQLQRVPLLRRPPVAHPGLDDRPPRRRHAGPDPPQRRRQRADRHAGRAERRAVVHRQLPRRPVRPADRGAGLALRGPADRPVRERVPADEPPAALRLQRARRHARRTASPPIASPGTRP